MKKSISLVSGSSDHLEAVISARVIRLGEALHCCGYTAFQDLIYVELSWLSLLSFDLHRDTPECITETLNPIKLPSRQFGNTRAELDSGPKIAKS